MEDRNKQEEIWDKHWEGIIGGGNYQEIIDSRFTKEAYRCIKGFINSETDKLILEAGCGTGRFCLLLARDFPDAEVVGIDKCDTALSIAGSAKIELGVENVRFEKQDLFSMNYPNNSYDVVFNEGVIEHFSLESHPTYKDALREMIRVTKRGGKAIVAVPNWYCFPHTFYKWLLACLNKEFEYGYEKSFKHRELIRLFREFNLANLELRGYYPAHGFYRFGKYSRIFPLLGKMVDTLGNKYIANIFGFMILIKGEKL